jgi:hypothetical protein
MIDQVKNWLRDQGFPLEMQTASEFRRAGFEVTLSSLYRDTETGKFREMDVCATHKDFIGVTQIAFFVECKSTKKPWLLLSDPEVLSGYHRVHSFAMTNKNAFEAIGSESVFDSLMKSCPWFRKEELTGYSLRSAFSDKDIAYEAAASVAKASRAFVNGAEEYQQRIAFPVIVVSSPLVRCSLDTNGEIAAEEIKHGEVFLSYALPGAPTTCIRVVTVEHLPDFVGAASQVAGVLRAELIQAEAKLWENHFSSPHPMLEGSPTTTEGQDEEDEERDG